MEAVGGACRNENAYKILFGMTEEKRPLGRPEHKWKSNVKLDPREIGLVYVDWIRLAEDRDQCLAVVVK
jgi:hypothetical protein